jgi:hypothetical protein
MQAQQPETFVGTSVVSIAACDPPKVLTGMYELPFTEM